jgi:hypothetical protein
VLVPEVVIETLLNGDTEQYARAAGQLKTVLADRNHLLHWRESDTIKKGLYEGWKAVGRKRSWRPSEKAAAMADFKLLMDKFSALFPAL